MPKPRLLDLFCGAGGAAMGYARAGFEVVGVDVKRQRDYPFEFHQADALTFPLDGFDAIHASPPCQAHSITRHAHKAQHVDLVPQTRERLRESGLPYVIENVPGAPLLDPITLCGSAFGLVAEDDAGRKLYLKRHRLFESSIPLFAAPCECATMRAQGYVVGGVYGGGSTDFDHARNVRHGGYTPPVAVRRALMGIDWSSREALSQAIPPVYTEFIGRQLRWYVEAIRTPIRTSTYSPARSRPLT